MNARHRQVGHKPHGNRFILTFAYHAHARTLAIPRFAAFMVFVLVPIAAVIYLGATCYFIFHDDVLARLMQRQADMQYAYEDRIAALRRDVGNAQRHADAAAADFASRLGALSRRQDQVETRTALIALFADHEKQMQLPAGTGDTAPNGVDPAPTSTLPSPSAAEAPAATAEPDDGKPHPVDFDLRLRDHPHPVPMPFSTGDASPEGDGTALSPESQAHALAARYTHSDAVDLALLDDLAAAPVQLNHDVRATLATLGLSASRFHIRTAKLSTDAGIGGPFVPLPVMTDGSRFANEAAQLQNALATAEDLKSVLPRIPLNAPLPGDLEVTSPFGPRIDPFLGRPALHTGVDLRGAYGDAVRATAPGRVTFAGAMGGYGNLVEVDNGNGLATRYAHLSSIDVTQGEVVSTGSIVGHIGDSGRATGPHLHYEVRIDGQPVDPERFLRAGATLPTALKL
jgi:murein DD-endopeptidase MepM/ murein hydrolase activator NlpD